MLRLEARVLGWETTSFPWMRWTCRSTRSGPVRPFRSSHWRARISPAQAGGQLQQEQLEAVVLFGLDQQALDLLSCQYLHLSFGWVAGALQERAGFFKISPWATA